MYPRGSSISCHHHRKGQELRQFLSAAGLLCMFTGASLLQLRAQRELSQPVSVITSNTTKRSINRSKTVLSALQERTYGNE